MKRTNALAILLLVAGSTAAMAQNNPADPANAGKKPGQGTTSATEDHSQHKNMGSSSGTSTGSSGTADTDATKTTPPANGKGVTPNSNSGGTKQ